jgi:hypothetical protein
MAAPNGRGFEVSIDRAVKTASALICSPSALAPGEKAALLPDLRMASRPCTGRPESVAGTPILELSMAANIGSTKIRKLQDAFCARPVLL